MGVNSPSRACLLPSAGAAGEKLLHPFLSAVDRPYRQRRRQRCPFDGVPVWQMRRCLLLLLLPLAMDENDSAGRVTHRRIACVGCCNGDVFIAYAIRSPTGNSQLGAVGRMEFSVRFDGGVFRGN